MKTIAALLLLAAAGLARAGEAIIDLYEFENADRDAVARLIGEPSRCETIKYGPKCYYAHNGAQVDVVFIGGKADWINVARDDIRQDAQAIEAVGLPRQRPAVDNGYTVSWRGMLLSSHQDGDAIKAVQVNSITAFPGYIYVKMRTR